MADIDVEDENILTSIFKDSFPESWQENPAFVQYLAELSSYGVDRLAREPDRLAEEKSQILAETQDLAFHNYTTFIETSDCSKEIFQDFQIIESNLDSLLTKLPGFSEECGKVIQKAQEISSSRRMNTLTLQRHTQLLEVLEMPQLMDTCVRNGYYEEALELAAYVKRLEKKHPNIPVIAGIVQEVKASTQLMLNQLIQQLRTNLQLPACLRVIGFLRRMDVFTEAELRIKFLQARDSWFQSILDAVPKGDSYTHITKTIEASRVHLFDIMTQFRAIFSDEDPLVSTGKERGVNESLLFQSWVHQKISQFLSILERDLEEDVGGRLDSIVGQCMYFGLSFSRIGADFRGLLAPIFERATLSYFKASLKETNRKFEDNMQSYNLLAVSTTGGLPFGMASSQSGQLYPPTSLIDFYPLASLCNHILTAFNDLRLCAPINIACQVVQELHDCLMEVNRVILAFFRAEETTFNAKEKDAFEQLCAGYATDLLPYINKCLQALYPPAQLATALGVSVTELSRNSRVGLIDINSILANITHLMPVAPAPPTTTQAPSPTPTTPLSPQPEYNSSAITSKAAYDDNDDDGDDSEEEGEDDDGGGGGEGLRHKTVSFTLASDEDEDDDDDEIEVAKNFNQTNEEKSPDAATGAGGNTTLSSQQEGGGPNMPSPSPAPPSSSPPTPAPSSSSSSTQPQTPPPPPVPSSTEATTTRTPPSSADGGDLDPAASGQGDWNDEGFDLDNIDLDLASSAASEAPTVDLDSLPSV